jgi:NAD(P)-dependent dehydrogenase (short-subunit alcohol dehydrogenase family)
MDLNLSGRKALVTGSTQGIGRAIAAGLGRMGAEVVVNGRSDASVETALARLSDEVPDGIFTGFAADLAVAADCARLVAAHSQVDVLVNNAGIYEAVPFTEIADEDWLRLNEVNVMSGVRMSRAYLPGMLERDWGRIVFISSESAVHIPPEMIHYGVTKAAQCALSRGLAELTVGSNVTVNSVLPGPTWVDASPERMATRAKAQGRTVDELVEDMFKVRRPTSLLRRYTTVDEVANMACYVCSPAASATNGAALRVEGGIVKSPI